MGVKGLARLAAFAAALMLSACGAPTPMGADGKPVVNPNPTDVVTEDFMISAKDDGIHLFLRNKHWAEYYRPQAARTVLFIHGGTFPGSATFDLALDGTSWMDWLARKGYDVYVLDIRGYGRSSRLPEMAQPAEANPPVADGAAAIRDVSKAVDFILSRRSLDRLSLVGWSWGATLAGAYTQEAGSRVEKLVLYAPQWVRDDAPTTPPPQLGAWRDVPLTSLRERLNRDVPSKERAELIPSAWSQAWVDALKKGDPQGASQNPPVIRVPNGAGADTLAYWAAGKPYWQPERISTPTLVIQGEWDAETPPDMGLGVFAHLTSAAKRRYVMIGEGTHTLLLEKNRVQLYQAVQSFLDESP